MSIEMTEEIKAIRVLHLSGQQVDWDEWSKKYQGIAAERGCLKTVLGMDRVPKVSKGMLPYCRQPWNVIAHVGISGFANYC